MKSRNVIETIRFVAQLKHVVTAIARPLTYAGNNSLSSNQVPIDTTKLLSAVLEKKLVD